MANRLALAKFVQFGYWITGIASLSVVYWDLGGIRGIFISIVTTMPFVLAVIISLKCRTCGVSYFFEPANNSWNITGVNLLKRVRSKCLNCGAEGAER
jgi:hypothetical protein